MSAAELHVRGRLCEPVLVRVLGALAARADLPVDRLADAQVAAGAIAGGAARQRGDGPVRVMLDHAPGVIHLHVGPLAAGGASRLLADTAVPGVGPVLERVADSVRTQPDGDGELLCLTIGRAPEAAP